MCRKNQMISIAAICFGAGLLAGVWIEWHFIGVLAGLALIGMGFLCCGGNRRHK